MPEIPLPEIYRLVNPAKSSTHPPYIETAQFINELMMAFGETIESFVDKVNREGGNFRTAISESFLQSEQHRFILVSIDDQPRVLNIQFCFLDRRIKQESGLAEEEINEESERWLTILNYPENPVALVKAPRKFGRKIGPELLECNLTKEEKRVIRETIRLVKKSPTRQRLSERQTKNT